MPLPAVPPPENIRDGEVDDRPRIVEERPESLENPEGTLYSFDPNEGPRYTFDPNTGALEEISIDNIDDAFDNIGGGLQEPLEKLKKNDDLSDEISAENRAAASEAEDSPPDGDEPPVDDIFKDAKDPREKAPEPLIENDEKIL